MGVRTLGIEGDGEAGVVFGGVNIARLPENASDVERNGGIFGIGAEGAFQGLGSGMRTAQRQPDPREIGVVFDIRGVEVDCVLDETQGVVVILALIGNDAEHVQRLGVGGKFFVDGAVDGFGAVDLSLLVKGSGGEKLVADCLGHGSGNDYM